MPSLDQRTMLRDSDCHVPRCQGEREYQSQYRSTETPGWAFVVLQVWLGILQYSNGKNGKDCGQHLCFPVFRPTSKRGTKIAAAPFRSLHTARRGLSNLPDKLQSKLNLPRSCRRPVELTSAADGSTRSIENRVVGCRWIEIGVVKDVENLEAELHVE